MLDEKYEKSGTSFKAYKFLFLLCIFAILILLGLHFTLPHKLIAASLYIPIALFQLADSIGYLFLRNVKLFAGRFILALLWFGLAYYTASQYLNNYLDYLRARPKLLSDCSSSNVRSCHDLAAAAHSWGDKEEAGKYYTAACFLGDNEACADWNKLYSKDDELKEDIRKSISKRLCQNGNIASCVQQGKLLLTEGKKEEALLKFETGCKADIADGCVEMGKYYEGISILKAAEYLKKACNLSTNECWREEFVCSKLSFNWVYIGKNGELDETLRLCHSICEKGLRSACINLDMYGMAVKDALRKE